MFLGYYTRSGYVPGPVCKYNWTLVWDLAEEKRKYLDPQVIYIQNNPKVKVP